ncbi:MAG: hypothetical protein J6P29_01740, partial [Acetobacter sp.]|nr:hypothetical protein [Acetobacter sp.]
MISGLFSSASASIGVVTSAAKACAVAGATAVSGALSSIKTGLGGVLTSLKTFVSSASTEFGQKLAEQAVSIFGRSLEIVKSKDLGQVLGTLVEELKAEFTSNIVNKIAEKLGIVDKG